MDIATTVLSAAISTGKFLFEVKEMFQGLPGEIEALRVRTFQIKEFAERREASFAQSGEKTSAIQTALLDLITQGREMVELFVKDCKEHKLKNLLGTVFGKGAKEKLEKIAAITAEMDNQLSKVGIEIAQMSFEKLQLLADSESKKYDASEILQQVDAKNFWIKYAGKENSTFPSWESFVNAVKASLNQRGEADLIARLLKHEASLKTKIAGKDGLVDVYEFDTLTFKYGWSRGLEVAIKEIEDSLNNIPTGVQNLLKLLETLNLMKFEEYKIQFISNQLTVETLAELPEKDLKKFLTEELKIGILDSNKITKAVLETTKSTISSPASPPVSPKSETQLTSRPSNLFGVHGYESGVTNNTWFCWRWVLDNHGNARKAVTIEDASEAAPTENVVITPQDLKGVSGYADELDAGFGFCWRWIKTKNSGDHKVITIESSSDERQPAFQGKVSPSHLNGINGWKEDCDYRFCWRWMKSNSGVDVRMLTLE